MKKKEQRRAHGLKTKRDSKYTGAEPTVPTFKERIRFHEVPAQPEVEVHGFDSFKREQSTCLSEIITVNEHFSG